MVQTTPAYKPGDAIDFEHMGMAKTGTILEVLEGGKVRIKDSRGYLYRYAVENVWPAGTTKPEPPTITVNGTGTVTNVSSPSPVITTTQIQTKTTEPMAKETPKGTASPEAVKKIKGLDCKKHQRIFLLIEAGCTKEEIMKHASANAGEISNVRKQYAESPEKGTAAKALLG